MHVSRGTKERHEKPSGYSRYSHLPSPERKPEGKNFSSEKRGDVIVSHRKEVFVCV
jgi:hypothetical protein